MGQKLVPKHLKGINSLKSESICFSFNNNLGMNTAHGLTMENFVTLDMKAIALLQRKDIAKMSKQNFNLWALIIAIIVKLN